jgi:hypothetical protein
MLIAQHHSNHHVDGLALQTNQYAYAILAQTRLIDVVQIFSDTVLIETISSSLRLLNDGIISAIKSQ